MTKKKKIGKLILLIVIAIFAAGLIVFGSVYLYYSTGHEVMDPKGFASKR